MRGQVATPSDAYWGNVSSLVHFDGASIGAGFADATGKVWTASGSASLTSGQKVFGDGSGLFDGSTNSFIRSASSSDFDFGSGDFTIEGWVRLGSISANSHILGKYSSATGPFAIYRDASNIRFYSSSNGTSWNLVNGLLIGGSLTTNTWYAIAICRSGNTWTTFLNGVLYAYTTASGAVFSNAGDVTYGSNADGSELFNGWLDEFRITKGVARYAANYALATAQFPNQ